MSISITSTEENLQWPSFLVMVKSSWLMKLNSCGGNNNSHYRKETLFLKKMLMDNFYMLMMPSDVR
jgi:hypothetical protein